MRTHVLRFFDRVGLLVIAAAVWLLPVAGAYALGPFDGMVQEGRQLFERQFAMGVGGTPGGDGLGPMFNQLSCAACHKQGGVGGAGPVDANAELLSVIMPPMPKAKKNQRTDQFAPLRAIHPGFVTPEGQLRPNLVLHKFGTDHRYAVMREHLTGKKVLFAPTDQERQDLQKDLARTPLANAKGAPAFRLFLTQRNTPALFGAGIIDAIGDEALHELAIAQQRHGQVSGRVAPVNGRKAGRFGWRGQTEHLRDFVLNACANELGLEVPGVSQPLVPQDPTYRAPGLDLTEQQCNQLVAFVASLPPPKLVLPEEQPKRTLVDEGHKLFKQVGCAQCHVEEVGPAKAIYSDLLLHDLGPALADPVLAQPSPNSAVGSQSPPNVPQQSGGGYSGGFVASASQAGRQRSQPSGLEISQKLALLPEELTQEWRTAPLWGLRDSAPYLHDGRAETVVEAIAWHDGEARKCAEQYFALPATERMKVLEFLACMQAP